MVVPCRSREPSSRRCSVPLFEWVWLENSSPKSARQALALLAPHLHTTAEPRSDCLHVPRHCRPSVGAASAERGHLRHTWCARLLEVESKGVDECFLVGIFFLHNLVSRPGSEVESSRRGLGVVVDDMCTHIVHHTALSKPRCDFAFYAVGRPGRPLGRSEMIVEISYRRLS